MLPPVVQHLLTGYIFDPADPRAPSAEQWAQMTPIDRERASSLLPSEDTTTEEMASEILEGSSEWCFLEGTTPIERAMKEIAHLESKLSEALARNQEAERRLSEALAEIERLKRG